MEVKDEFQKESRCFSLSVREANTPSVSPHGRWRIKEWAKE